MHSKINLYQIPPKYQCISHFTWYTGAQGHKANGCHRVLDVEHTAKIGSRISDNRGQNANDKYWNDKGDIAAAYICER